MGSEPIESDHLVLIRCLMVHGERTSGRGLPGKSPRTLEASPGQVVSRRGVIKQSTNALGDCPRILRVNEQDGVPADFRKRGAIAREDWGPARHGLQHGKAKTLIQRGHEKGRRAGQQGGKIIIGDEAAKCHVGLKAEVTDLPDDRLPQPSPLAGNDEGRYMRLRSAKDRIRF